MKKFWVILSILTTLCFSSAYSSAPVESEKVFILGLDGATWRVLLPLMDAGFMPNLKYLLKDGIYGVLYSQAAYSPISWNSIFTGKSPKKHGISGLYLEGNLGCRFNKTLKSKQEKFNVCSYDRKVVPDWKILSDSGKRVGVIGFLTTYPADPINGCFISGDTSPNLLSSKSNKAILKIVPDKSHDLKRVFSGEILNNEIQLIEESPNKFRVYFPEDPAGNYGYLKAERSDWMDVPLDSVAAEYYSTLTDVRPCIQKAAWIDNSQTVNDDHCVLEISIPSDVSPRHHGKHRNRPLFIYVDGSGEGVRFSYLKNGNDLFPAINLFGFEVKGKITRGFSSFDNAGEVILEPQISGGVNLVLNWEKKVSENEQIKNVRLSTGLESAAEKSDYDVFWNWALINRKLVLKSPVGFLGMTYVTLNIKGEDAILNFRSLMDSFHRPTYNFVYPPDLLADFDYSKIKHERAVEIYRNQQIKKILFDHVFDPDEFDVFWLCYTATDLSQHYSWNSPDPLDYDLSKYNQLIIDRWIKTDEYIGELMSKLGPEWSIVVCSDHGFHKVVNRRKIDFNWNQLLVELGLLKLKDPPPINWDRIGYQPPRQECYRVEMTFRCKNSKRRNTGGAFKLLDKSNKVVASSLFFPGNGGYPTSYWQPGEVVKSTRDLAFDERVPPGQYRLTLNVLMGRRSFDLGTITVPESPPSLIPAEGLFRISDVEVFSGSEAERIRNATKQAPLGINSDIELLDWQISQVETRYMEYLNSCARRIIYKDSKAVLFDRFNDSGIKFAHNFITLLHPESFDDKKLLEDLIHLAESMKIVENGKKVFNRINRKHDQQGFKVDLNNQILLGEQKVSNVAFLTFDAQQHIEFEFRGEKYTRELRHYLKNKCNGFHQNEGVYAISGYNVPDLGITNQAIEWDIAPTVLKMSHVSLPGDMDGESISWEKDGNDARKVKEDVLSNEELYEQLQAIGYLSNL